MNTKQWSVFSCGVSGCTQVLAGTTSPKQALSAKTAFSLQNATSTRFDEFWSRRVPRYSSNWIVTVPQWLDTSSLWNNCECFLVKTFAVHAARNDASQVELPSPCFLEWKMSHFLSHVSLTELGPRVAGWQQNKELPRECVLPGSERLGRGLGHRGCFQHWRVQARGRPKPVRLNSIIKNFIKKKSLHLFPRYSVAHFPPMFLFSPQNAVSLRAKDMAHSHVLASEHAAAMQTRFLGPHSSPPLSHGAMVAAGGTCLRLRHCLCPQPAESSIEGQHEHRTSIVFEKVPKYEKYICHH